MLEPDVLSSVAAAVAEMTQPAVSRTDPLSAAVPPSDEARRRMIAEAAYYHAEHRGFATGAELEDWLQAEQEIAQQLEQESASIA